jgi:hypothetical protein
MASMGVIEIEIEIVGLNHLFQRAKCRIKFK